MIPYPQTALQLNPNGHLPRPQVPEKEQGKTARELLQPPCFDGDPQEVEEMLAVLDRIELPSPLGPEPEPEPEPRQGYDLQMESQQQQAEDQALLQAYEDEAASVPVSRAATIAAAARYHSSGAREQSLSEEHILSLDSEDDMLAAMQSLLED